MAGIQTKSFHLLRQPTYWEQLQQRRERSRILREQFEAQNADINAAFANANADKVNGAGELAAKAALKRISQETEAKFQKAEAERSRNSIEIWKNDGPPSSVTEGGTTVDLSSGTIKLSDGTVIDAKTGKPPGNFLKLADGTRINLDTGHKVIDIVT